MANLQDYLNFVENNRNRRPLVKLEILRQEDESPLKELVTELRLDGSLNVDNSNGTRRSFSATLDNALNQFFPSLDSGIWVGQKVRLSLGYIVNNEEYFIRQGVFVHTNPTSNPDKSLRINANDKFSLLDGSIAGVIDSLLIIPASTTVGNAIRSVMLLSQDPKSDEIIIDSSVDSEVLPYQILKEDGQGTIGEVLIELAEAFSCNVYYNENGNLVFEKDTSDSIKGSIWEYNADSENEINYISGTVTYDFENVKNSILVIGDNINGQIFRAKVQNNDLLSPTSIANLGLELLETVKDDIIYSTALCIERGKYELKRKTNVSLDGRFDSVILPHFDVDRVIEVTDSRLNLTKKRLLIDSISMPLNNSSSMSITVVDTFDIDL